MLNVFQFDVTQHIATRDIVASLRLRRLPFMMYSDCV